MAPSTSPATVPVQTSGRYDKDYVETFNYLCEMT